MEIPVYTLILTGHILALWMPVVRSGCLEEFKNFSIVSFQNFIPLKNEMEKICRDLREGKTDQCSDECDGTVRDIMDYFTTYFTCDCSDLGNTALYTEEKCLEDRERLGVCSTLRNFLAEMVTTQQTSTTPTIFENGKMPCDWAHRHCQEDGDCMASLENTITACSGGCSEDCQRSVDALLTLRHAQSLWECIGCRDGAEGRWCHWSKLCKDTGTLESYRPGEEQSSTEKTTGTKGGSVRQSGRGDTNGASPHGAVFVTSVGLYTIICVSLSILFG